MEPNQAEQLIRVMIYPFGLWRRQCLKYSSSAWLQQPGVAHLKRAVLRLSGPETIKYLQGMCTSNIFKWQADGLAGAHYTCFLNPHVPLSYCLRIYVHALSRDA